MCLVSRGNEQTALLGMEKSALKYWLRLLLLKCLGSRQMPQSYTSRIQTILYK